MNLPHIIRRNLKQAQFLEKVLNNTADSIEKGRGAYQRGVTAFLNAGRAFGKTVTLLDLLSICAYELPRSLGGLGSKTFKQVQEIILGQSEKILEQHELYEYDPKYRPWGNYVINKRPPSHFARPYTSPKTYENVMSFANGAGVMFMAADRANTTRGITIDWYLHDEFAFSPEDFYTDIIKPGIRGNKYVYKDNRRGRKGHNHPLHWGSYLFSSAPRTLSGSHIYKYQELSKKYPDRFIWMEGTAYDNIENLPGDMIKTLKEDLSPIAFDIEVMNKRPKKVDAAFYAAFDSKKHCYSNYGYDYNDKTGIWDVADNDYDPWKPIEISFDFNSDFTCLIVCQDFDKEFRILKEMWVKESLTELVTQLATNFCNQYKDHLKKKVFVFGDHSGNKRSAGLNQTFFATIFHILRKNGWEVYDEVQQNYPPFTVRYKVLNALLAEQNGRLPRIRINDNHCPNLILSLQYTETRKETFEKNKKDENNKSIPAEQTTHLSDAFDYILFRKYSRYIETESTRSSLPSLN